MKKLLTFLVLAPLLGMGQGVHFESGLSWEQVVAKAKAENKFIFVDCYASWCGPCKMMDRDVYPNDTVGEAVNARFVSVRVQMDTAKKDDDAVKAWYADAHMLMTTYKISAFPSFLFFSPDGKIVHRGLGLHRVGDFVKLIAKAQDPTKQYYTILAAYRAGSNDFTVMPLLASDAKKFNEPELAFSIAADYLHDQLDKLSYADMCNKNDLNFIAGFAKVVSSKDKVFRCLFEHGELADSAMQDKDFAKRFVNYVVTKEEITPAITTAKAKKMEPDWITIGKKIKYQFGQNYVEENIVNAKVDWYKGQKNWKNYTRYLVMQMDIRGIQNIPNGLMGIFVLNNGAWDIFQYSNNRAELEKALAWIDRALQMDTAKLAATMMDTKANLLYKLGQKQAAIQLETKAAQMAPEVKDIQNDLQKMESGQPTWVAR